MSESHYKRAKEPHKPIHEPVCDKSDCEHYGQCTANSDKVSIDINGNLVIDLTHEYMPYLPLPNRRQK